MSEKKICLGPVEFGDQGIEYCLTCRGCICCDFEHIDHENAERECVIVKGQCALKDHAGRPCKITKPAPIV